MNFMRGMEKCGVWLRLQLMRSFVFGVFRVGFAVAMKSLRAFRPVEFMPFTGTETEGNQ